MKKRLLTIFAGLNILIICSSCLSTYQDNIEATKDMPTLIATVQVDTIQMAEPTNTMTVTPIKTVITKTPSRIPTMTPVSFTVFPTLDSENYQKKFQEWHDSQENCAFPCLWNLEPGISDIQSVWTTVHDIFPDQYCRYKETKFYCFFSNDSFSREFNKPMTGIGVHVENNKIERLSLFGDFPNKSLNKIVAELGFPDEAYLFQLIGGEGFAESSLLLVFNKSHAIIEYYKGIQITSDETLTFCITETDLPTVELFSEGEQLRYSELPDYAELQYQSFADVVGTDFANYYQSHHTNGGTLCIVSRQSVW